MIDAMQPMKAHLPVGGRLKYFVSQMVFYFSGSFNLGHCPRDAYRFNSNSVSEYCSQTNFFLPEEMAAADEHIKTLLLKRAIVKVDPLDRSGFLSNVFLTPKKDGGFRMILNLKKFNEFVQYNKFKMETLQHILSYVQQGFFMATLDLTDAYLTVPVSPDHAKYLKFQWRGVTYMYIVMPFGIAEAPRKFTKLLKPILAELRGK